MPDGGDLEIGAASACSNSRHFFDQLTPKPEAYKQPLTIPLAEAMDWKAIITHEKLRKGDAVDRKYYIVAFRSVRTETADREKLYAADGLAYDEAMKSGGLLRYWYGILNERRECLAMCIWESREQALAALHLPAHMAAMELVREMYEAYVLERYWLIPGPDGNPIIEKLPSSPHGLTGVGSIQASHS